MPRLALRHDGPGLASAVADSRPGPTRISPPSDPPIHENSAAETLGRLGGSAPISSSRSAPLRGDPTVNLYLARATIAITLRAKGCQQTRCHNLSRSRQ